MEAQMNAHEDEFPAVPSDSAWQPEAPRPDVHEIGERLEALYPRIVLDIASAESDALEQLAALGIYGASADDVATYLIIRGLDDLARAGILPLNFERKPDLAEAAE
jgi:hypothetical protein